MYMAIALTIILFLFKQQTVAEDSDLAKSLIDKATTKNVNCETTKGNIELEIYPAWSPLGAKHFLELVEDGYFQDIALYRCVRRFLTQFGITDNPKYKHWNRQEIRDDPNLNLGIKKYYLSFAGGGPNTRSTQLFISFEDLDFLGKSPWETPFGKVVKGEEVVDSWYTGYGDMLGFNTNGPDQQMIYTKGNQYLREKFPKMDYIISCSVQPSQFGMQSDPSKALAVVVKKEVMIIEAAINITSTSDLEHKNKPEGINKSSKENLVRKVGRSKEEESAGVKSGQSSGLIITDENEVVAEVRSFLTAIDEEAKISKEGTDALLNKVAVKLDAESLANAPKIKLPEKNREFKHDKVEEVSHISKNAEGASVEAESDGKDLEKTTENKSERNGGESVEAEENENSVGIVGESAEAESENSENREQLEQQAEKMSKLIAQKQAEKEQFARQSITNGAVLEPMESLSHRHEVGDNEEIVDHGVVIEEREAPLDVAQDMEEPLEDALDSLQQGSKIGNLNTSLKENNFILQLEQGFEDKFNKAPILVKNNLRGVGEIIYKESVLFSNHFLASTLFFMVSIFACFLYLLHVDRKKIAHAKAR